MKKKMLAAVLAGTMVMSLGTNLCWADGEKTKVTMTVWNGEWGDQLDRTMESFNSKHDDIELDITMQSGYLHPYTMDTGAGFCRGRKTSGFKRNGFY